VPLPLAGAPAMISLGGAFLEDPPSLSLLEEDETWMLREVAHLDRDVFLFLAEDAWRAVSVVVVGC